MSEITEDQLNNFVNFVNCNSSKVTGSFYKYMSASRVFEILENEPHQIGFVSPEKWYDPYETIYLNTDYTALNNYKQPKIYCFCARKDKLNEEASWKIYKNDKEPLLCLSIDTKAFLINLVDFAKNNQCDIFLSKIDYRLRRTEIDNLYLPSSSYYHEFFDNFDDKQYVKVMSLKRRAFRYENEYRIFVIPKNQDAIKECLKEDGVLNIPITMKTITKFVVNPTNKPDGSLSSQIEKATYEAAYKYIKERIVSCYPEAVVKKSILYSKVKKVESIEV